MSPTDFDVIVAGGGPAGSLSASALARRGWRVLLADGRHSGGKGIGAPELLAPAGSAVLDRLGLSALVDGPASSACRGILSDWDPERRDFTDLVLLNLGRGRIVDRPRFDAALRRVAAMSGVTIERPACLEFVEPRGSEPLGVRLRRAAGVAVQVTTSFVIEATGRRAAPGPAADECARRLYFDRLVAVTVPTARHDDVLRVAPSRSGWWYTAGVGAVFVTDGDLLPRERSALTAHLERERGDAGALPIAAVDATAAHAALEAIRDARTGCRRAQRRGRWLPIGDSAFTLDPLSGSGLTRALRMAEAVTAAVERYLGAGDPAGLSAFAMSGCAEFAAARTQGARLYARGALPFADSEFWRRRAAGASPRAGPHHRRRPPGARGVLTGVLRESDHPEPQEGEP